MCKSATSKHFQSYGTIVYLFIGLPRYQVKEQQESSTSYPSNINNESTGSEKNEGSKIVFRPLYFSKDSQPCFCSACVGAVATVLTPVSYKKLSSLTKKSH